MNGKLSDLKPEASGHLVNKWQHAGNTNTNKSGPIKQIL